MKTPLLERTRRVIGYFTLVFVMVSTVACAKGDKGKTSPSRSRTGTAAAGQSVTDPRTGQQVSSWGAISHAGEPVLYDFMLMGPDQLGYVSQSMDADTGIRFRGFLSSGQIEMLVWDSKANDRNSPDTYQQAFYWTLRVVGQPQVSQSYARVTVQDEVGQVTFDGTVQNGMWNGQVTFQNSGGASGRLGQFSIIADHILR